jgi:hypothetical protein
MDEGRQLFLKALQLRFHCKYEEARRAFEEAAQHGSGDACWYIYVTDYLGGPCYIAESSDDDDDDNHRDHDEVVGELHKHAFEYLAHGSKLGNSLCVGIHHVLVVDPDWKILPSPPNLAAEIWWWEMFPDEKRRTFTTSEVAIIQKAAEQAVAIHDVWPVATYLRYVIEQEMMKLVDPCLIAHALCLFDQDEIATPRYKQIGKREFTRYLEFDFENVIERNHFELSLGALFIISCVAGKVLTQRKRAGASGACVIVYHYWKKLADQRILAWMGCFRRKKLTWLSRDTATLIAKIMANPIYWTNLPDTSINTKKKK